jgi:hypothetical protein
VQGPEDFVIPLHYLQQRAEAALLGVQERLLPERQTQATVQGANTERGDLGEHRVQ